MFYNTLRFKVIIIILVCLFGSNLTYAAANTDGGETETGFVAIATQVSDAAKRTAMLVGQYRTRTVEALTSDINDLKVALAKIQTQRFKDEAQKMPFHYTFMELNAERVFSRETALEVKKKLYNTRAAVLAGHITVENSDKDGSPNPLGVNANSVATDRDLMKKLGSGTPFCIPNSKLAVKGCRDSSGGTTGQNYSDFILGNGTWPDATVLDVMALTRRFFSKVSGRIEMSDDSSLDKSFIHHEGDLARDNLAFSILDGQAARRAASSNSTSEALDLLTSIFAMTGQVSGGNYQDMCQKQHPTLIETYICSFTSSPISGGTKRLISQEALDKIMHDFVLSPEMYININSTGKNATGSIDRLNVYFKAQQVAQDYRALRLLQQKTAMTAANLTQTGSK